jgi:hypothetical protein
MLKSSGGSGWSGGFGGSDGAGELCSSGAGSSIGTTTAVIDRGEFAVGFKTTMRTWRWETKWRFRYASNASFMSASEKETSSCFMSVISVMGRVKIIVLNLCNLAQAVRLQLKFLERQIETDRSCAKLRGRSPFG